MPCPYLATSCHFFAPFITYYQVLSISSAPPHFSIHHNLVFNSWDHGNCSSSTAPLPNPTCTRLTLSSENCHMDLLPSPGFPPSQSPSWLLPLGQTSALSPLLFELHPLPRRSTPVLKITYRLKPQMCMSSLVSSEVQNCPLACLTVIPISPARSDAEGLTLILLLPPPRLSLYMVLSSAQLLN